MNNDACKSCMGSPGNRCCSNFKEISTIYIIHNNNNNNNCYYYYYYYYYYQRCILGAYAIVSSIIGQFGDQVTLISPVATFEAGTELAFYFHMRISDQDTTAALTVYTYSELRVYDRRLLEIRGNRGISWQKAYTCLPAGTYQLAFVATHGLQFLSDIALDEISLHHEEDCLMREHEHDEEEYVGKRTASSSCALLCEARFGNGVGNGCPESEIQFLPSPTAAVRIEISTGSGIPWGLARVFPWVLVGMEIEVQFQRQPCVSQSHNI